MRRTIRQTVEAEEAIPGGRRVRLRIRADDTPAIPALLLRPGAPDPVAAALLLHGYTSRKEHLSDSMGRALLRQGVASLALDLPLHGEREDSIAAQSARNPVEMLRLWRLALEEARLGIGYLIAREDIDAQRIGIIGYSLGSFLATRVAADESRIRALVVAAGGDLPAGTPFAPLARMVADPLDAVRRLGSRPLLVVHGRNDRTVRPDQAERLFDAAAEPKELRWWDAGHILPTAAVDDAADWLARQL